MAVTAAKGPPVTDPLTRRQRRELDRDMAIIGDLGDLVIALRDALDAAHHAAATLTTGDTPASNWSGVGTRAARKDNPTAWRAAATKAIRAEVVTAAETAATLAPHLPHHTEAARPGDGHSDPNAGKPAGDTITLTAEALADLIEPAPAPPPLRPEERTQRAAQALATRDRTCPHCHGSNNWLDDNGNAHECDHHP